MGPDHRLTDTLAGFAAGTRLEDLPAPVVAESRRLLLDTLGCALGAIDSDSGRVALAYVAELGGNPRSTVLGGARSAAPLAAYVNARLANVLDADDTFPTATHFGNATIASALAMAEHCDRGGADLIAAIATGFEVGARIGSWMGAPLSPGDDGKPRFNALAGPAATVTWAAVGAAVNVSGASPATAAHAFGIAGAHTPLPSLHKFVEHVELPMAKYTDAGWCAQTGVSAALLARAGSTGFAGVLDGPNGFWRFYGSPARDDAALLDGLGNDWQILHTTYKPWPCCRFIHYPLTALERLLQEHAIAPDEIERIVVRAAPFALSPIFHHLRPADPLTAEFSHAHAVAALVLGIQPGPRWLAEAALRDSRVDALRQRVSVIAEPSCDNILQWMEGGQWRRIPGGVDIHARGQTFSATVEQARGDPWSPDTRLSDDDLLVKFRAMLSLDEADRSIRGELGDLADEIIEVIATLEERPLAELAVPLERIAAILATHAPARPAPASNPEYHA